MIGQHTATVTPVGGAPVDVSCLVDSISIVHGRDDTDSQPDASSATLDFSFDTDDAVLPGAVEIGATLDVSTQLGREDAPSGIVTVTNHMVNPSLEANLSGWGVQWFGGAPGAGTYDLNRAAACVGGWGFRKIWTVASTHDNDSGFNFFVVGSLVGGKCYAFRVTTRASKPSGMIARVQWRDPANVAIGPEIYLPAWGVGAAPVTPANTWQVMTGVLQAPPGTTGCRFVFGVHSNNGAVPGSVKTWAIGDTHDADRVLVAEVPSLTSPVPEWFDGDSPDDARDTYAWTAGAHGSRSTWARDLAVLAINKVPDPRYAALPGSWTVQGATVARVADPDTATGYAAEITHTSGSNALFPAGTGLTGMPVMGGATYRFRFLTKAMATARTAESRIFWYTATGAACAPIAWSVLPTGVDTVGSYAERTGTAVAPLDARFSTVWVRWVGALAGEQHRMAEPMLMLASDPPAYFDGDSADTYPYSNSWAGAANASPSVRRPWTTPPSVRFHGRITDVALGWDDAGQDTPDRPVGQVLATGILADLGRRVVGAEPFPQELDGARVKRVLTAAGVATDPLNIDPGTVQVLPRDIDSQPALDVAQEAATSAMGLLWTTRAGAVCYADAEHRRNLQPQLVLDACDVLVTPTWKRTTQGLINDVSLGYGTPPLDPEGNEDGEQPRWLGARDDSKARYGTYAYSLTTVLAAQPDAAALGNLLLTRNSSPVWVMAALPVDLADLDPDRTATLLAMDLHSLLNLTGLPAVGSAPTSAVLWLEGITETLAYGVHDFELAVSGYCRTSPPPRWDDVPPAQTWDTAPGTWDEMACLLPQPTQGRWADVSASLHWNQTDPAVTWDTWKG